MISEILFKSRKNNFRGAIFWKAIDAGGNGRQCNGSTFELIGNAQGACHGGFEFMVFVAVTPDGSYSMNHIFRRQTSTGGPGGIRMRNASMFPNPGIRLFLNR